MRRIHSTVRSSRLLLIAVLCAGALPATAEDAPPMPDALARIVEQLPEDKRDFFMSDDATMMSGTRDKLYRRLDGKSAAVVEAYIDGMLTVFEDAKFDPDEDMAAIPLDTDFPGFSMWKTRRPKGLEPAREPGPFSLNYYAGERWDGGGIRTFGGFPVAIYPEDLEAGDVDVAIVGAPLDMGSGIRGQKFGPMAMRNEYGGGGIDMYTMVDPSQALVVVDYGDIAVDNMSTERTVHHVRERVAEIAATGAIPFIVGGDHSLEYPDIAGLADVHGKGSFGVVHFDSHYDAGRESPHFITHGAPVYRAVKEGHVKAENYIQVGLRGPWPSQDGFEWMRDNGMRYHTMPEIVTKGWDLVMEQALAEARDGEHDKLFISFDVDVIDPAFVPGTGTPVPGGLNMREAITIVRRLCAEKEIIGFEIVELLPIIDDTYRSALNANFVMHACLTGIAMQKQGITEPGYVSELTQEHNQPEAGIEGRRAGRAEEIDPDYAWPQPR